MIIMFIFRFKKEIGIKIHFLSQALYCSYASDTTANISYIDREMCL